MDYRWHNGRLISNEEYSTLSEVESVLYSRALGFIIPFVTFMIIGMEIGDGAGAIIGLIAGGVMGLVLNSFLARMIKWVSVILTLAVTAAVIILMFVRL